MTDEKRLIPNEHHVVRYIRPAYIDDGIIDGNGFLSRPGEGEPSVNWLECFDPPTDAQVAEVRRLARISYAATGVLARLSIGRTVSHVMENAQDRTLLEFIHDELAADGARPEDKSHALILGVPVENTPEGELLKDLIAQCVIDMVPARAPTAKAGGTKS